MAQYQRKLKAGTRWWYKFDYKGKTYSSACIYVSKKEAQKAEYATYEEVSTKILNTAEKPILSLLEAITERLDYVEIKKSRDYYKDNKRYYTILLNTLGNVPITTITRKDIEKILFDYASQAKQAGRDNYAVNYMLNLFSALFNYAIEGHELVMRNPCQSIQPFAVRKKIKYIPSDADIKAVRNLCDAEQKLLLDFVAETGARINEPLKVTGKDILDSYVILYTKKSRNSNVVPRKVPKPECIEHIALKPDERLFKHWSDTPKFLERKIQRLKQKEWNWHNLRHRRACLWSKQGLPLYEIMSRLGHSNLSTTQKYLQMLG